MADTALVNGKPSTNGKPKKFTSGPQVSIGAGGRQSPVFNKEDKEFSQMLLDPTIALAVEIMTAILLKQPWSIECKDEGYGSFVWSQLEPYRKFIIQTTIMGFLLKGYRIYEVLYDIEEVEETYTEEETIPDEELPVPKVTMPQPNPNAPPPEPGEEDTFIPVSPQISQPKTRIVVKTRNVLRQVIAGVKSLRPEMTDILLDEMTGDLIGCENTDTRGQKSVIDKEHTVFVNLDKDGYGEYGKPMFRAMQGAYRRYNLCEKGAQRYDEKVAGGFLLIKHPIGSCPFNGIGQPIDQAAPEIDHAVIADRMAKSMRSVGYACIPLTEDDQGKPIEGWSAEFLSDSGQQGNFIDRLKYLDGQKLRAVGIPERSATEGSLGTKAEAEAHADVAIMVNEQLHERVIDSINPQILEPLNQANMANPGICRLIIGKLDPDSRQLFGNIFVALLQDPMFSADIIERIDQSGLMDKLDIPIKQTTEFSEGPDDA